MKRADAAFSTLIIARDGRRCVLCGAVANLTCGHVFSATHYAARWDERNAFCQCAGCNLKHEFDPYPFIRHAILKHGLVELNALHDQWAQPSHIGNPLLRAIVERLESNITPDGATRR